MRNSPPAGALLASRSGRGGPVVLAYLRQVFEVAESGGSA
jgi:hypothetical protein